MSDTTLSEERGCVDLATCSTDERVRFFRDVRSAAAVAIESHSRADGAVFSITLDGWSYRGPIELKLFKFRHSGAQLKVSPPPSAPSIQCFACSFTGHDFDDPTPMIEELLTDIHKSIFARAAFENQYPAPDMSDLARTLSETVEPQGGPAPTPSASPDHIKQWTKSGLITPGKVWLIELPQPSDGQPTHSEQSARLELLGDDMMVTVKGHNGCISLLNLSADARRALAAVLLEGLM